VTPVEQHLEDYEAKLLDLVHSMIRGNSPKALEAKELKLKTARKALADHIETVTQLHVHSQYELKTYGLP
jgi:hypothetical protein